MKKVIIFIFFAGVIILAFKINSVHYKNLADDRIGQVIKLQGANIEKARIEFDEYDYFASGYVKEIYFNDDADIKYSYDYEKSRDIVKVSAWLNNASLDLTGTVSKYDPFLKVRFDSNGKIENVEKR